MVECKNLKEVKFEKCIKKIDYTKPILFGTNFKNGKVYAGLGRISAKFYSPDKKGYITHNGKKVSLKELFENKSEDYKEWNN